MKSPFGLHWKLFRLSFQELAIGEEGGLSSSLIIGFSLDDDTVTLGSQGQGLVSSPSGH